MRIAAALTSTTVLLLLVPLSVPARGQEVGSLFPPREVIPALLAGARDPKTSVGILYVGDNPNRHGKGIEAEVSIGMTLPILLLAGKPGENPLVVGIEGAAFARFGLQVLEPELVASDWLFGVPLVWHWNGGWLRFRYLHFGSQMGDEYVRCFQEHGVNLSRDAAEVLAFRELSETNGTYAGARYTYAVHPEESERWVLRTGGHLQAGEAGGWARPFLASDLEWDQDAGGARVDLRIGL
jgi:hypothetical protein